MLFELLSCIYFIYLDFITLHFIFSFFLLGSRPNLGPIEFLFFVGLNSPRWWPSLDSLPFAVWSMITTRFHFSSRPDQKPKLKQQPPPSFTRNFPMHDPQTKWLYLSFYSSYTITSCNACLQQAPEWLHQTLPTSQDYSYPTWLASIPPTATGPS